MNAGRRKPEYLSPSALKCYKESPETYYTRYLASCKMPADPQTQPMAAGSAFDAFIKSYLHRELFGLNHKDHEKYDLDVIFDSQVDVPHRDWARRAGAFLFSAYKDCGALADLMMELGGAATEPRFESSIKGIVEGRREGMARKYGTVTLLGKPDVYFINHKGAHVILDWKVNGFCGPRATSPTAGYRIVRDCHHPTRSHGQMHPQFIPHDLNGMEVDGGSYLEEKNKDWAAQLATYGWLLGEPVGAEIVVAIDQIVASPQHGTFGPDGFPCLRVASHRSRVSQRFQIQTIVEYTNLWNLIHETPFYFFRQYDLDTSERQCQALDEQATSVFGPAETLTAEQIWLLESVHS